MEINLNISSLMQTDTNMYYTINANSIELNNRIHYGQDNESLIIGNDNTNKAGTKGFVIEKAVREGNNYYYILRCTDPEGKELNAKNLAEALKEVRNPKGERPTYSLRTYYLNSKKELKREYADDYGTVLNAIETTDGKYIKVQVSKVKKTDQPIPDDITKTDPSGYGWQETD
jgi:hypothetical protein